MNDPAGSPARGYRPQDLPGYGDPENFPSTSLTPPYGPGNPPPEDDGFMPVETYTTGPNLRVVALECAARVCTPAGAGVGGVTAWKPAEVLAKAGAFLAWLEAGE